MAKSIMDKVTDYSKSLVGKNLEPESKNYVDIIMRLAGNGKSVFLNYVM